MAKLNEHCPRCGRPMIEETREDEWPDGQRYEYGMWVCGCGHVIDEDFESANDNPRRTNAVRIINFQAENFKRLRVVDITPDGDVVTLTGANEQGKSSVLDAIAAALEGAGAVPTQPIRTGETVARIRLDLGDVIVTRSFTEHGASLRVEAADTKARFPSPQAVLDQLVGRVALDPLEFVRQKSRERYETLRGLIKLDVDVDELDRLNQKDFEERTGVNRDARRLETLLEAAPEVDCPITSPIDLAAMTQELSDAARTNTTIERQRAGREEAARTVAADRRAAEAKREEIGEAIRSIEASWDQQLAAIDDEIENLRAIIKELEAGKAGRRKAAIAAVEKARTDRTQEALLLEESADALESKLKTAAPLADPVDVEALTRRIETARTNNDLFAKADRRRLIIEELAETNDRIRTLTAAMADRKQARAAAFERAALPIAGLSLGDGEVLYQGVPIDQASGAGRLRVSVAVAMAMSPKLKVICVRDGSLLDEVNLAVLIDLTREAGYQLWIERTDTTGKVGIVLEDGAVRP